MLGQIAARLPFAHSLADLASQLHADPRELRRSLLDAGLPTEFDLLREELGRARPDARLAGLSPEEYPWELLGGLDLLDAAETLKKAPSKSGLFHPDRYRIEVPGDDAYLLIFTGDWHIGEAGTDHARLKADARLIGQARFEHPEHVRVIAMGDYIGGYMRSKTPGNNHQVLSPADQREAARDVLRTIEPDLVLEGDHDGWHNRHDNETDWLADFCRDEGYRFAQWGAALDFASDSNTLKVLARHRFDGSRKIDPYRPQVLCNDRHGYADVVALAHVHSNPGAALRQTGRIHEPPFWAVQSGTYKSHDEYAKKLGLGHGEYGVPCLLVFPADGEILPYARLEDGLRALRATRR